MPGLFNCQAERLVNLLTDKKISDFFSPNISLLVHVCAVKLKCAGIHLGTMPGVNLLNF